MVELRWVLLGLGAALLLGVYLWGRGALQRFLPRAALARRWLPSSPELRPRDPAAPDPDGAPQAPKSSADDPVAPRAALRPDRVITVRFVPKSKQLSAEKAVLALRAAGRVRGRWFIVSAATSALPHSRLAVRVAKKVVRSAVARNRIRRCVKEVFRQQCAGFEPADFLVSLIHPYREPTLRAAREELERLLPAARR